MYFICWLAYSPNIRWWQIRILNNYANISVLESDLSTQKEKRYWRRFIKNSSEDITEDSLDAVPKSNRNDRIQGYIVIQQEDFYTHVLLPCGDAPVYLKVYG